MGCSGEKEIHDGLLPAEVRNGPDDSRWSGAVKVYGALRRAKQKFHWHACGLGAATLNHSHGAVFSAYKQFVGDSVLVVVVKVLRWCVRADEGRAYSDQASKVE